LLNQAHTLQQQLPYSLAWNDVRVLQARLYLAWGRPEQATAVFDKVLAQARAEGIPGMILRHGPAEFGPLLELAARRSEQTEYATSLLRLANLTFLPEAGPVKVPGSHETLSGREVEVLRLLAARATNREIAEQLVISETTVKSHVQHILQKLNLSSRTDAAACARQLGLI
jgi:DNA-binding NarL/FixJ family response regulator